MRRLRAQARAAAALIGLAVIGLGSAAYIVAHQRLRLPFVDETPFQMQAELATAQAVTPGQGQTVRVAGVQIGEIAKVRLRQGRAIVSMDIQPEYRGLIRRDASALLRPKTGLKDMFLELDPGRGPRAPAGWTMPIENTAPDVNLDEILAMLDRDTRDYLRLLVDGAGRGLRGRGGDLREVYRMFEPTHRDLARVNSAVATRRASLRRLINSLERLGSELGRREDDLAELVDGAARVFRSYAAEDTNITRAVEVLPDALRETTDALGRVERYAQTLGPTAERLRPVARELGDSNRALQALATEATPILRTRIRPFVRESRPLARDLRPAATNLSQSTPNLTRTFKVLNHVLDLVAYNPNGREGPDKAGREEGYLFWIGWVTHLSANVFATADAHGSFRPSLLTAECAVFRNLVKDQPEQEFLMNLTPLLTNPALCGPGTTDPRRGKRARARGHAGGSR